MKILKIALFIFLLGAGLNGLSYIKKNTQRECNNRLLSSFECGDEYVYERSGYPLYFKETYTNRDYPVYFKGYFTSSMKYECRTDESGIIKGFFAPPRCDSFSWRKLALNQAFWTVATAGTWGGYVFLKKLKKTERRSHETEI